MQISYMYKDNNNTQKGSKIFSFHVAGYIMKIAEHVDRHVFFEEFLYEADLNSRRRS